MDRLFKEFNCDADQLSPLTLAFLGDCVYDLFVREMLVCEANRSTRKLHSCAVEKVKASAQAQACEKILPLLTEKEMAVFKRGRNAHPHHMPKNGTRETIILQLQQRLFSDIFISREKLTDFVNCFLL